MIQCIGIYMDNNYGTLCNVLYIRFLIDGQYNKTVELVIQRHEIMSMYSNNLFLIEALLEHIWDNICKNLMINPYNNNILKEQVIYIFFDILQKNMFDEMKCKITPPEPKLPEEVEEALRISKKAQDIQKYIVEKQKEIQEDKRNYYKKYGNLWQKMSVYLKLN